MKALLQRVSEARVAINGQTVGEIQKGLLVLLCAVKGDTDKDLDYIIKKVVQLRIFGDELGKMNLSVMDVKGEVLVISQFSRHLRARETGRPLIPPRHPNGQGPYTRRSSRSSGRPGFPFRRGCSRSQWPYR
jgi:D-tyrosyl-tRNA(Tyr) deacylase